MAVGLRVLGLVAVITHPPVLFIFVFFIIYFFIPLLLPKYIKNKSLIIFPTLSHTSVTFQLYGWHEYKILSCSAPLMLTDELSKKDWKQIKSLFRVGLNFIQCFDIFTYTESKCDDEGRWLLKTDGWIRLPDRLYRNATCIIYLVTIRDRIWTSMITRDRFRNRLFRRSLWSGSIPSVVIYLHL